jgi:hypothetical protein
MISSIKTWICYPDWISSVDMESLYPLPSLIDGDRSLTYVPRAHSRVLQSFVPSSVILFYNVGKQLELPELIILLALVLLSLPLLMWML